MGISASIDIYLTPKSTVNKCRRPICKIIEALIKSGWRYEYGEVVNLLPVGHKDEYTWPGLKLSHDEFWSILNQKEDIGETIGVSLSWEDTETGGTFLFEQQECKRIIIMFSITYEIQKINNYDLTNVSWYIERIVPYIPSEKFYISEIVFKEVK